MQKSPWTSISFSSCKTWSCEESGRDATVPVAEFVDAVELWETMHGACLFHLL